VLKSPAFSKISKNPTLTTVEILTTLPWPLMLVPIVIVVYIAYSGGRPKNKEWCVYILAIN
jgi:hypothetical protein